MIKVTSEFQLFGILLVCLILQTADTDKELFDPEAPDCSLEYTPGSTEHDFCRQEAEKPWLEQVGISMRTVETRDGFGFVQTVLTLSILPLTVYFLYKGFKEARQEAKEHMAKLKQRKAMGGTAAIARSQLDLTEVSSEAEFHNPLSPNGSDEENEGGEKTPNPLLSTPKVGDDAAAVPRAIAKTKLTLRKQAKLKSKSAPKSIDSGTQLVIVERKTVSGKLWLRVQQHGVTSPVTGWILDHSKHVQHLSSGDGQLADT